MKYAKAKNVNVKRKIQMNKRDDEILKKYEALIEKLYTLKKSLDAPYVQSNRKPVNALGVGWSQDPATGAFHHSTHGIISTAPHKDGGFEIRHGGGVVGRVNSLQEAGQRIKEHVAGLGAYENNSYNRPSTSLPPQTKMGKPTYTYKAEEPAKEKKYSPAQLAAMKEARKLKKSFDSNPWVKHGSVPNADEELTKLNKTNPVLTSENLMATQLANLMQGKAMLGTPPPKQPTDEEMFGHLVVTEEMEKAREAQWQGNAFNSFLQEATKPISQRFNSEEEEIEYWNSIKVSDRDDGSTGY